MNVVSSIQTLAESFVALSDEVQSLIDRKTILEHKLRYAHEQYQYLADKYAPAVPEVSETLAKLHLPPDLPPAVATTAVPLPKRSQTGSSQHQIALLIREGRRAAQELAAGIASASRDGDGEERPRRSAPAGMDVLTSVSTVLEQDFTVQGKQGALACPFSAKLNQDGGPPGGAGRVDDSQDPAGAADPTPHQSSDPICAAMLDVPGDASAAAPSKCPIRYLDKHSPEEIARYVETHKHAIPRSHEVCVRRYQRNEDQIRKLDAKYGDIVSMVEDLSHLHRPMLPPSDEELRHADRASSKRVEDWTRTVVAGDPSSDPDDPTVEDAGRESRFDRPMRDVRLGESPSRPWGISVPLEAGANQRQPSPPRPVKDTTQTAKDQTAPRKCPFDHSKMFGPKQEDAADPPAKQPATAPKTDAPPLSTNQPTFVNVPEMASRTGERRDQPQVVFNISGPVFIGYPMEQAIEFMKQFRGQ